MRKNIGRGEMLKCTQMPLVPIDKCVCLKELHHNSGIASGEHEAVHWPSRDVVQCLFACRANFLNLSQNEIYCIHLVHAESVRYGCGELPKM